MKLTHCTAASAFAFALTTSALVAQEGRYVDSATIRQVQQTLNQRGVKVATDGLMGPGTQAAIKSFQQSEKLEPTGNLNRQTLAALGLEPRGTEPPPALVYSASTIQQVQQTLNNRGFKAGPVDGTIGSSLQASIREFQRSENLEDTGNLNPRTLSALGIQVQAISPLPPAPVPYASVPVPYASVPTVRQVQHALKSRGFLAGPVDGMMGPATERALRQFQESENLQTTGQLNRQTVAALGVQGG